MDNLVDVTLKLPTKKGWKYTGEFRAPTLGELGYNPNLQDFYKGTRGCKKATFILVKEDPYGLVPDGEPLFWICAADPDPGEWYVEEGTSSCIFDPEEKEWQKRGNYYATKEAAQNSLEEIISTFLRIKRGDYD